MEAGDIFTLAILYVALVASVFFLQSFFEKSSQNKKRKLDELPNVTIAVPVHNGASCLAKTLQHVANLDYPKDKLQILVLENGKSSDESYEIAKQFERKHSHVTAISLEKGGKGNAMNHALSIASGEFFASLDDDSYVTREVLKRMLQHFSNPEVMAVTPALKVYKPKTILQHVQKAEYALGIFLREAFAGLDSIHITPGAFTIYRKSFFDEHGGFDDNNITEDMEIAMRIQHLNYRIGNAIDAPVYTESPARFKELGQQRLRWYLGFLENIVNYKSLFNISKHGVLAAFVLPLAFLSVFLAILASSFLLYYAYKGMALLAGSLDNVGINLKSIGLLGKLGIEAIGTPNPIIFIALIVVGVSMIGLFSAARKASDSPLSLLKSYIAFFAFYSMLYAFFWLNVFNAKLFGREFKFGAVVWRNSFLNKWMHHKAY
jgi:cellulose synthase/poly-beta-1,6-N-acetylglucosamine synthase-like glycosyltransferase